ncbi:MAG: hypothetical protein Q8R16_03140 [bacterium]|nr:hypothetical protein [bacterium]
MYPVIGHAAILSAFERLVTTGQLGHAYLLAGPAGVGKSTVATWIAARLLCTASGQRPCERCDACAAVARSSHPDVLRLSDEGVRSVESVREWTSALACSTLFAGWKIGIVEGAEQMNEAGANACLKTIEEPTPKTVILLTAPSRRAVLPTIASRCVAIPCARVPTAVLTKGLQARTAMDAGEADALAALADGCPGRAIACHGNPERRARYAEYRTLAHSAVTDTYSDRLRGIESFSRDLPSDRLSACEQTMELVQAFRDIGRETMLRRPPTPQTTAWLQLLVAAPQYLRANVSPRLLLETIAVTYPSTGKF